jgi:hypothetical protein
MRCMAKRLSVTLEPPDVRALDSLSDPASPERRALADWARGRGMELPESAAEAALLRMLVRVGADHLRTSVLDLGYARLAVELVAGTADDSRRARDRYVDRTERQFAG